MRSDGTQVQGYYRTNPNSPPHNNWSANGNTAGVGGFSCGPKRYCREMTNCAEARFYLNQCGVSRLDGDGDGVPCESICR
ncbi:excalibur calcium-binding domain-containing protein [Roseomonas sp. GCM10028921]